MPADCSNYSPALHSNADFINAPHQYGKAMLSLIDCQPRIRLWSDSIMQRFHQDNLKIAHKGLILAFVPLLTIFIILGVVVVALDRANDEMKRQAHSKLIIDDMTEVDVALFEAMQSMSTFAITR